MKKILILGVGAFGFAIAKHLGDNNPDQKIYAFERNIDVANTISTTRKHPYFFGDAKLPMNIELIADKSSILPDVDIIISVIPCQFVWMVFDNIRSELKDGVTILNLSKGIDNTNLQVVSEELQKTLKNTENPINYTYAYLAGGMIAQELVNQKMLWADIVCEDENIGKELGELFSSSSLTINLKICNTKNTELYAALKNIIALILGYHEGQWVGMSTLGYYFSALLKEMTDLIPLLGWNSEIDFSDYALSGDLIATCFGASRNRFLWNMLWEWKDITIALEELHEQKKIAEWYETLKGVYQLTKGKDAFIEINNFWDQFIK